MKSIVNQLLLIVILIFIISCEETKHDSSADKPKAETDSLKVFYYNHSKKSLDSLIRVMSAEILATKGIDVIKFTDVVGQKDSLTYEYYEQYSYWLSFKHRYFEAIRYLNIGSKFTKEKSRFYFDKACAWAFIEPLGRRDTVYFYLDKAVKDDSLNGFYYAARSKFHNEDDNNDNLMSDINMAIKLDPAETSYVNQRGAYKIIFEDYEGALKDLRNIAYDNKYNAQFYFSRAIAYHKLKKRKEALLEADKCLQLDPNNAGAYLIRGNSRYQLGEEEEGVEDFKKAAKLGDKDAIDFMQKYDEFKKTHRKS